MKIDLLSFAGRHSKLTLVIILIITAFFAYHTAFLHLDGDYTALMSELENDTVYQGGTGEYQGQEAWIDTKPVIPETMVLSTSMLKGNLVADLSPEPPAVEPAYSTSYLVMVESENLFTPDTMNLICATIKTLEQTDYLSKSYSVLDFVTLNKRGTRLVTVPFSTKDAVWTDTSVAEFKTLLQNDPIIKNYLVSEDLTSILFSFDSIALTVQEEAHLSKLLQPLREAGIAVSINGGAVITNLLMQYLSRDLSILLTLCFIAILFVYYMSFKAKRSVLLPFSMSVIGIIWTFGTMRLLGYSLTIVNIITPCMVLNLGSSYAIHVIGEYYTDYSKGLNSIESTKKILRTIFFACLTTVIGFMSLLFSETPALREFGIAVGIGVTYCAILASTYLPAQLTLVVPPKQEQIRTYKKGYLARIVMRIEQLVARKWLFFVLLWLVVIAGFILTKDSIPVNTNYMSYLPKRDPFGQSSRHFAKQMGGDTPFFITIEAPEGEEQFFLKSENLSKVYDFEQTLKAESQDIKQIISFASYVSFANKVYSQQESIPTSSGLLNLLSRMVILLSNQDQEELGMILNPEGTSLTIIIQNWDAEDKDLTTISSAERIENLILSHLDILPNGTQVRLSGEPHRLLHFSDALLADQQMSTYASYILVFLVVLLAFKSVSLAFYSLIPILTGVMANYTFMYFFQIPFDMITVSFASIAVGTGIDDAIHFLIRYKNNLKREGKSVDAVLGQTIRETGRPIMLTTLSIVAGMLMFLFASYTPVRYFGSLMSVALMNCMLSTLVVMPSVIKLVAHLKKRFIHQLGK